LDFSGKQKKWKKFIRIFDYDSVEGKIEFFCAFFSLVRLRSDNLFNGFQIFDICNVKSSMKKQISRSALKLLQNIARKKQLTGKEKLSRLFVENQLRVELFKNGVKEKDR
jgi:hypothetical protein